MLYGIPEASTELGWNIGLPLILALVLFFAAFVMVDGVFDVFHAVRTREVNENWWVLLLEGLLGIAFGVITWANPQITTLVLLLYIAFKGSTSPRSALSIQNQSMRMDLGALGASGGRRSSAGAGRELRPEALQPLLVCLGEFFF